MSLARPTGRQCTDMAAPVNTLSGTGELSAIEEVRSQYGLATTAIATLDDLLAHLHTRREFRQNIEAIENYRKLYGTRQHAQGNTP